jgi:hypothetical protein
MNNVHFDTRQYNHIVWSDPGHLRGQLHDRIVATIGQASYRHRIHVACASGFQIALVSPYVLLNQRAAATQRLLASGIPRAPDNTDARE